MATKTAAAKTATRVVTYAVVRHGANAANQGMAAEQVVELIECVSRRDALEEVERRGLGEDPSRGGCCYANQRLSLRAWSAYSGEEQEMIGESLALDAANAAVA
jgi:hypothetical protein